jgi:hypothetical protein
MATRRNGIPANQRRPTVRAPVRRRQSAERALGLLRSFTPNNCLRISDCGASPDQCTLLGHLVCSGDLVVRKIVGPTGSSGVIAALPSASVWRHAR